MKPPTRNHWERLIVLISGMVEQERIPYHLDGSTALYVQGIDFEMDDLDITVKWGCLERARKIFSKYHPTRIGSDSPGSFHFKIDGLKVHIMSYKSPTGIGRPKDRIQISVANVTVWSKTVDFYRRNMKPDHPLAALVANAAVFASSPSNSPPPRNVGRDH